MSRIPGTPGCPKYLCLYSTADFDVLDSATYRGVLANPTEWSIRTMARFKNMIRAVTRITISRGTGRGAALGLIRLRPAPAGKDELRAALRGALDPGGADGIISMHLIESDAQLSRPTTGDAPAPSPGAGDWFVLIDGTSVNAVSAAITARFGDGGALKSAVISTAVYHLMWDLAKSDIRTV